MNSGVRKAENSLDRRKVGDSERKENEGDEGATMSPESFLHRACGPD